MVPATIFSEGSFGADARTFLTRLDTQADKIVCRYSFPRPAIKIENGITDVSIEGLENFSETGKPVLPVSYARIVIPAGKKILSASREKN